MTDKEYQHALDLMEKGIRADEREKILEHQTIIYDLDGIGHKVVFVKNIKEQN